jgi:hypothetical protein
MGDSAYASLDSYRVYSVSARFQRCEMRSWRAGDVHLVAVSSQRFNQRREQNPNRDVNGRDLKDLDGLA